MILTSSIYTQGVFLGTISDFLNQRIENIVKYTYNSAPNPKAKALDMATNPCEK